MDIDAVAKKVTKAILDRVEDERCLHASSIEDEIAKGIKLAMFPGQVVSVPWPTAMVDQSQLDLQFKDGFAFLKHLASTCGQT